MSLFIARSAAAVAALGIAAAPAFAAGYAEPAAVPVVAPVVAAPAPVAAPFAADGDWTGFYAGGQLSYGDLSIEDSDADEESGALYGLHAGYQRDFGRFVLGAEASSDFTDITVADGVDVDGVGRVGLRAGYDGGRFLPYLTAGYARVSLSAEGLDDETYDGGYAGLGVSYALTENVDIGAEVLRHRFDVEDADMDVTTVGVRASYRF